MLRASQRPELLEMEVDLNLPGDKGTERGDSANSDNSKVLQEWTKFLSLCIAKRLESETFETYVQFQAASYPLPPRIIADIFLRPQPSNQESLDPRIPRYLQVLIDRKLVDTPSILNALYKYSTSHSQAQSASANQGLEATSNARWKASYASEETIFYRLSKAVGTGSGIKSASDAIAVCKIMSKWMTLFGSASAAFAQDVVSQLYNIQSREDMETSRAAFVMLLLAVTQNQIVLKALSRPFAKEARRSLSESLSNFVPSIMQNASQIATQLELFRTETLAAFEPVDENAEAAKAQMDDPLDSALALESFVIPEIHITNTRAGLYIYLNALLVGRPLLDDHAFYSYLHNRYGGDIQSAFIDLILASFDVLANAVFRSEGQKAAHLLRSYLINKLPLLLAALAPQLFPPATPQYCITEALSQVDTNAFPTLSAMFDVSSNNNTFTDSVRQDFCFACCLHGLIPEAAIEGLLGEITYQTLPTEGRYVKETLVDQCLADPEKVNSLIGELDNMDGNVGAVCQALAEVIVRACGNKETMSLKHICSQLAKKPLSLDVMLLFEKPTTILHPLCELLDNWRYEDDQGEYQPVYEEFGAILLLVLAFVNRYKLHAADLGVRSPDSFVAKLLSHGYLSKAFEDLTQQERDHLGGWIIGLFNSESGVLGDELMSSCPPQDFYLLVSTLFHQIVVAVSVDRLSEESLKSGIEYVVDTFLFPSLVTAITYLSGHLRLERPPEQKAVIRILQLILLTKHGSSEAQGMLSAVLNVAAKPLEQVLRSYQRMNPQSQDIEPLLHAIKENVRVSRRTGDATANELEAWTSASNGGLGASLRHTLQGFVNWSLHPGGNMTPPSYTHRQILAALKIMGPKGLLHVILEETKQQTEAGNGSVIYDVATALICAPDVRNSPLPVPAALLNDASQHQPVMQSRVSLRQMLRWEAEDFKKKQQSDPVMAEHIVRLHRRVEAQLMLPQAPEMLEGDLTLGLGEGDALGGALAAAQGDGLVPDDTTVNLDLGGAADMNLDLGAASSAGGLGLGGDDDIFGSLGGVGHGADLLDGWDDMGMDMDMS